MSTRRPRSVATVQGYSERGDVSTLLLVDGDGLPGHPEMRPAVQVGMVTQNSEATSDTPRVFLNSYVASGLRRDEWRELASVVDKLLETT
jgi:hypothetical protein